MVAKHILRFVSVGVGGIACVTAITLQKSNAACAPEENYTFTATSQWDNDWDKRHYPPYDKSSKENDSDEKKNTKSKAVRHLFLIRHGQYDLDAESPEKRILTNLGREQADYTGKRLKSLNLPFSKIVISTMPRAQETGAIIAKYFPNVQTLNCDFIREGAPIRPEPSTVHWRPDAYFYQDGARIEAAFRKYFHRAPIEQVEDSYELLVCHANVIRYFVCRALQLPPEAWLRMSLHNGSLTWITIRPNGRVSLRTLGDAGFMPVDKLTTS